MKVCVVGSGGREHALVDVLSRSAEVVVTPGNPGIPGSVATPPEEIEADLFVIGPEAPLVDGLADRLRAAGKLVFGPGADGAQLEGSKAWMKDLLAEAGVPTAAYGVFSDVVPAQEFLDTMTAPYVIKTDGLAAGKGVLVTDSIIEAQNAIEEYLSGASFGDAGRTIVIEEGLVGPEVSILAICDGTRAIALSPAQDFKRVGVGDIGPNTGGMGAYSPLPFVTPDMVQDIVDKFITPTLETLTARGIDYRGVLYAGLMLTLDGPKMLEYNVRFGDPECQVVLPRITSDLTELLYQAASGNIVDTPSFTPDFHVAVVCASEGYPTAPRTGDVITGIQAADQLDGVSIYAAGVSANDAGDLITAGGRVLNVCGHGATLKEARDRAQAAVDRISWDGMFYRDDIGANATDG